MSTKSIVTMAINDTSISWMAAAPLQSNRSTRKPNMYPENAAAPSKLAMKVPDARPTMVVFTDRCMR